MSDTTDLQIKLTHLERFVDQLNEVIVEQQSTIDALQTKVDKLSQGLQSVKSQLPESPSDPEFEKPPHY